jgi:hypothetical protein
MAVVEEVVRMLPKACGDSDPRSLRTKRSRSGSHGESRDRKPSPANGHGIQATTESLLDQLAVRLARSGGPILVASRSEIRWPKPVVTLLAGFAGDRRPPVLSS